MRHLAFLLVILLWSSVAQAQQRQVQQRQPLQRQDRPDANYLPLFARQQIVFERQQRQAEARMARVEDRRQRPGTRWRSYMGPDGFSFEIIP